MAYNTLKNIPTTIQNSLSGKADLSGGKLPSSQLPDEIDARIQVLNGSDAELSIEVLGLGEIASPNDQSGLRKGDGVLAGGQLIGDRSFFLGSITITGDGPVGAGTLGIVPAGAHWIECYFKTPLGLTGDVTAGFEGASSYQGIATYNHSGFNMVYCQNNLLPDSAPYLKPNTDYTCRGHIFLDSPAEVALSVARASSFTGVAISLFGANLGGSVAGFPV
jgi:hypothetical protein